VIVEPSRRGSNFKGMAALLHRACPNVKIAVTLSNPHARLTPLEKSIARLNEEILKLSNSGS
jgi:hypothetical protein